MFHQEQEGFRVSRGQPDSRHTAFTQGGYGGEVFLDGGGRDVSAVEDDEIFGATRDAQFASDELTHISGVEPSVLRTSAVASG